MEKLIGNLVALKISWRHFSAQLRSVGENKKRDLACVPDQQGVYKQRAHCIFYRQSTCSFVF